MNFANWYANRSDISELMDFLRTAIAKFSTSFKLLSLGYLSQFYSSVVSLAFTPFILATIGAEAYGLVGIFVIMQAWFQIIDGGLTPALKREAARFGAGENPPKQFGSMVCGFQSMVLLLSIVVLAVTPLVAPSLAEHWVNRETLSVAELSTVFELSALILLLRWFSGIFRAILTGIEQHVKLYSINVLVSTLRYPCIVVYFYYVDASALNYFIYQLFVGALELIALWWVSRRLVPGSSVHNPCRWISSLRPLVSFAATHGLMTSVWILAGQIDKLLMTRLLTLSEFGYVSLGLVAASSVSLISTPITQLIIPKLAKLKAQNRDAELYATYSSFTRTNVLLLCGVTSVLVVYGREIMFVWTGDLQVADKTADVLSYYTLGNAIMGLCAFSYYLQFAFGRLRMHTLGGLIFVVSLTPTVLFAIDNFGISGAAKAWAGLWLIYLLCWVSYTHSRFLNGKQWKWLFNDVLRMVLPVSCVMFFINRFLELPENRFSLALTLCFLIILMYCVAGITSGKLRLQQIRNLVRRH